MKVVPDTSVLINGKLAEYIKGKQKITIIIPKAVLDELQAQASRHKDIGFQGLEELKKLRKKKEITLKFVGDRPTLEEIQLAKKGRIDAIIRDVAVKEKATLLTSDFVQALVGEAEGVSVKHIPQEVDKRIHLETFFDRETQSVHLKAGVPPHAKKGTPGNIRLVKLRNKASDEHEIKSIIEEVLSKVRTDENSFIEIGKQGATVVQLGKFRISITRTPFSDGLEVTAVRPIAKLDLKDYELHSELEKRLTNQYSGILIAGPPGSGKSTFAASVAEFLSKKGMIVKTFEQPRDLQVSDEITQYAPLEGDWEKTAELLLLVRPDYTIFDEIRRTKDFRVFGDMRLAGVGMIGVVHSTTPVSAIQRSIGRWELGTIPHIVDTIIFIRAGRIEKVFELNLTVKVPFGMKEQDLARPVVEIRDYETKSVEYEIYTFGEENVIMPVKESISPIKKLAKEKVLEEMRKYDPNTKVEILSEDRILAKVSNDVIARIIGKKGANIDRIENKLGINISVEPLEGSLKQTSDFSFEESGAYLNLLVDNRLTGKRMDIYSGDEFLFSAFVGKKGKIRVKKKSSLGKAVMQAIASGKLRILN